MPNKIKLVVSDIDGTLLTSTNILTPYLKKTVKLLSTKRIPFILASARAPQGIFPLAKELGVHSNPLISYNGAFILNMKNMTSIQCLRSYPMNNEVVVKLIDTVKKKFPAIAINIYSENNWFVEREDKWIATESSITKLLPVKTDFSNLYSGSETETHKLLLIGEKEDVQTLFTYLEKVAVAGISFYQSKENYLEIVAAKVSKKMAVKKLAEYYHLMPQEILTIGDQFNDVPMLKFAGTGVAMGNASTEVKQAAKFITATNDEDGVAKALKYYVL
ncbi:Cof-type HAD-IIB family hydrolase [Liquorilactobacillus capillatus]|nr:Cof-type HAD-IIB family hydrolase [Liquorilactobacillus capillatus]